MIGSRCDVVGRRRWSDPGSGRRTRPRVLRCARARRGEQQAAHGGPLRPRRGSGIGRGDRGAKVMSSSGVPIGAYYFALSGAMGLYIPYLAMYLSSVGMSEAQGVQVQAVVPFMSLVVPPLLGMFADARGARIWVLRGFTAATLIAFAALAGARGNAVAITLVLTVFAIARAPLVALVDATAHDHVRRHGGSYGRLRTWGSGGYLATVILAGMLYDAVSIQMLVPASCVGFGVLVLCAWRMPAPPLQRELGLMREVRRMLRTRSLWLLLFAVPAAQAATTCYDAMLVLHFRNLGYGNVFTGVAISIGVAAEVVLLAMSGRVLTRFRPERALAAACVVGVVRWLVLAQATSEVVLLVQAPLHAITFGLYWVSATTLLRDYAGPRASAAGQGLLAAAVAVGAMIGNVYGGALFEQGGGQLLFRGAAASAAVATGLALLHAIALGRARTTGRVHDLGGAATRSPAGDRPA
jgi:MFS transporter, PPP family, 3-phenylpropionic acid transporter